MAFGRHHRALSALSHQPFPHSSVRSLSLQLNRSVAQPFPLAACGLPIGCQHCRFRRPLPSPSAPCGLPSGCHRRRFRSPLPSPSALGWLPLGCRYRRFRRPLPCLWAAVAVAVAVEVRCRLLPLNQPPLGASGAT